MIWHEQIKTRRLTPRQLEVEAGAGSGSSWQQSLQVETGKESGAAPTISVGQWLQDRNIQVCSCMPFNQR